MAESIVSASQLPDPGSVHTSPTELVTARSHRPER